MMTYKFCTSYQKNPINIVICFSIIAHFINFKIILAFFYVLKHQVDL